MYRRVSAQLLLCGHVCSWSRYCVDMCPLSSYCVHYTDMYGMIYQPLPQLNNLGYIPKY